MSYEYKFSNVESWSDNDKSDIKHLYQIYFKELGLEFNESLDPDFVTPGKYFSTENRGAYLTLIYTPPENTETSRPKIIGVVGVRNYSDVKNPVLGENCCEIKRMFILEEHRGGKRGRRLFQTLMDKIYELKYDRIVLDTKSWAKPANYLYESFGFVDCPDYNQNWRADRWMKKDITEENKRLGYIVEAEE